MTPRESPSMLITSEVDMVEKKIRRSRLPSNHEKQY